MMLGAGIAARRPCAFQKISRIAPRRLSTIKALANDLKPTIVKDSFWRRSLTKSKDAAGADSRRDL